MTALVRVFDGILKYGKGVVPLALWLFGAWAFLRDACGPPAPDWSRDWGWAEFRSVLDAGYRSAQLFVLEFDRGCADETALSVPLEAARTLVMLFVAAAVVSFLVPRVRQWALIRLHVVFGHWLRRRSLRAVVLGYGRIGQAVARELSGRRRGKLVVAIHKGVTPALEEHARRDNVILVEGDPSDPAMHRRVRTGLASHVYAAMDDDMQTLDAAVAARAGRKPGDGPRVHVLLSDPGLAAGMAETASRGFLGAADVGVFSLASEAARLLIAEARFDRTALELGQERVHLIIVGCGTQGEAVAIETLLTAWRSALGPPAVTVFDKDPAPARERFHRRAPELFREKGGRLPPPAAATVEFAEMDADTVDFGTDERIEGAMARHGPATAWVFAAGDDALNMRAAAALYQSMLRRALPPAPIHVRVWSGHEGDTPELSAHPLGIARSFGALEKTLANTPACQDDPDLVSRQLHDQYVEQGREVEEGDPLFRFDSTPWSDLPETKRNSNRRLHRHAIMKFEDLGGQSRHRARSVPVVDPDLRDAYIEIENDLAYQHLDAKELPAHTAWWTGDGVPDAEARARAESLLAAAFTEHNRWTVDRALDGWRLAQRADASLRDDERRLHDNMHPWSALDHRTRRWDAILLRALVKGSKGRDEKVTAWRRKARGILMATGRAVAKPGGNVPSFERSCRWVLDGLAGAEPGLTELDVVIGRDAPRDDVAICAEFERLLGKPEVARRLCRVRFDFPVLPGEDALALANTLGGIAARTVEGVEVSALWGWDNPHGCVHGFIGHRDLDRVGGADGLAGFLDGWFARLACEGGIGGLVSGYAPGADRIAADAWIALGLTKPVLLFPYDDIEDAGPEDDRPRRILLTDARDRAGLAERVAASELKGHAEVHVSPRRPGLDGHRSQALDILERAQVLVAVYDGRGSSGEGSVGDTIEKALAMGRTVIVVDRDGKGNWQGREIEGSPAPERS